MVAKLLVVVLGATGAQGGSVCRALLADGTFRVRAITRKPESEASKELLRLGAEVFKVTVSLFASLSWRVELMKSTLSQADINVASDLDRAFAGSSSLFALTDCWDPELKGSTDAEFAQGKGIADAATKAGVELVVYSGGPVVKLPCPMCNGEFIFDPAHSSNLMILWRLLAKTLVQEYFRKQAFKCITVNLGWYMTNWVSLFPPRIAEDGKTVDFAYPIFDETFEFPMVATEIDTGPVVLGLLKSPERFWGKVFYLASEWVTLPQIAAAYSRATGQPAKWTFVPKGDYDFVSGNSEWTNMNRYCVDNGGFASDWADIPGHWEGAGGKLGPSLELHPRILTWEAWVKKSGFDMFDPVWQKELASRPAEWDSQ
ncbi:hypothetical protein P7C70_g1600, partial [Phenoliferia sp. Uapishka_3]